jgi:hypothetical protein
MPTEAEIDTEVLEEGCYCLSQLGLSEAEIASHFGTTVSKVRRSASSYARELKRGEVVLGEFDRTFWDDVRKEAEGDVKVTFVSDRGLHHAWKSELNQLSGEALMSIFESSKDFLVADPNQRFLDHPAPKGYDPLALDREVTKAVTVVSELLQEKWEEAEVNKKKTPNLKRAHWRRASKKDAARDCRQGRAGRCPAAVPG